MWYVNTKKKVLIFKFFSTHPSLKWAVFGLNFENQQLLFIAYLSNVWRVAIGVSCRYKAF